MVRCEGCEGCEGLKRIRIEKIFKKIFLFYFYFLSEYFQALHRSPFTAPQPRIFRIILKNSLLIINFDEFESKPAPVCQVPLNGGVLIRFERSDNHEAGARDLDSNYF